VQTVLILIDVPGPKALNFELVQRTFWAWIFDRTLFLREIDAHLTLRFPRSGQPPGEGRREPAAIYIGAWQSVPI